MRHHLKTMRLAAIKLRVWRSRRHWTSTYHLRQAMSDANAPSTTYNCLERQQTGFQQIKIPKENRAIKELASQPTAHLPKRKTTAASVTLLNLQSHHIERVVVINVQAARLLDSLNDGVPCGLLLRYDKRRGRLP